MRRLIAVVLLLGVAACGVDGPPVPPADDRDRPEPGITISGTAEVGVSGGSTRVSR
ncbi:MAG: argininosuccinate lyase [Pseudomonadota bacterium]